MVTHCKQGLKYPQNGHGFRSGVVAGFSAAKTFSNCRNYNRSIQYYFQGLRVLKSFLHETFLTEEDILNMFAKNFYLYFTMSFESEAARLYEELRSFPRSDSEETTGANH